MKLLTLLLICVTFMSFQVYSQLEIIHDVENETSGQPSNPKHYVEYNGKVYFSAVSEFGEELWVSDGTNSGTKLVKDINPGLASSTIEKIFVAGNLMYLFLDDGIHGLELWKSDGTESGTQLVKDIYPGSLGCIEPVHIYGFEHQNNLFFTAADGVNGYETWISDGTNAGTQLLTSVRF
jgi:ELWxxDGT repeat protein